MNAWDEKLKKVDRNPAMEKACLEAHREGRSRPLQEFIDELKDLKAGKGMD